MTSGVLFLKQVGPTSLIGKVAWGVTDGQNPSGLEPPPRRAAVEGLATPER